MATVGEDLVDQFCSVTGASRERAEFFLSASQGNLQASLDAYYNNDTQDMEDEAPREPVQETQSGGESSEQVPSIAPDTRQPDTSVGRKLATLSDYSQSSGKKDTEQQEFFAGGSEHSGQVITGPSKKKDLAGEMFEAAKQQGAVPVEEEKKEKSKAFRGTGFRLGEDETTPSAKVEGPSLEDPAPIPFAITFWRDGFTVNDGPLRNGKQPEDEMFLQSISRGEIPDELRHAAKGGEVDVTLADRRNDKYYPPKPKLVAFSGEGHKLGNVTPAIVTTSTSNSGSTSDRVEVTVSIDTSLPVTSLQIRLADGTRLQSKFNHSHTVGDVRQFILDSCPEMRNKSFILQTTFPNKVLHNMDQSLSEAGLLNAVIVQRLQ